MEVRCASCNKLFRVSDDKITGSGIKFACTRCGSSVKITREDLEQYSMAQKAAVLPAPIAPVPSPAPAAISQASPSLEPSAVPADDRIDEFDLSGPAGAAAAQQEQKQTKPAEMPGHQASAAPAQTGYRRVQEPAVPPKPTPEAKAKPAPQPKPEPAARPVPKPVTQVPKPEVKPSPKPQHEQAAAAASPAVSSSPVSASARPSGSKLSNKLMAVVIVAVIVLGGAVVVVKNYLSGSSKQTRSSDAAVSTPDGLQVQTQEGLVDPVTKDLIVRGTIENSTDAQKPAWYIAVDVYDAQGSVIASGKFVNGKQYYSRRDYEVLAKRGVNIQELKTRNLQEQGVIIPPKSTVPFEIRILEPPVGIASFNAGLQPFDPVQMHRQMTEEQK